VNIGRIYFEHTYTRTSIPAKAKNSWFTKKNGSSCGIVSLCAAPNTLFLGLGWVNLGTACWVLRTDNLVVRPHNPKGMYPRHPAGLNRCPISMLKLERAQNAVKNSIPYTIHLIYCDC